MVRMRDAARVAGEHKAEMAAIARDLDEDLARARQSPAGPALQTLMDRLEATAAQWRAIAAVYEPFIAWEAEPS
jgi:hypothetical protein